MFNSIAIVGAGPSGCALACFLAERNIECTIFDDGNKPELLVGESLVPGAIPIIRRLGLEQQVAAISKVKRGAGLRHGRKDARVDFEFQNFGKGSPEYAYNIPRPQFDSLVAQKAISLGVKFVKHKAKVVASDDPERELRLSDESLAAAGLSSQSHPDLLVDATGRARLFSKVLNIRAIKGPRNDVAHFAHFENYPLETPLHGQIMISVLDCGWSWQIPLKDKTSVGVVINAQAANQFGANAEQRLTTLMAHNPVLSRPEMKRVTDVKTYANYQLVSEKAHGPGWVLVGDALGFVDPMLSPGVFLALQSAELLDAHLQQLSAQEASYSSGKQQPLDQYYQKMRNWHFAWSELIEYFYDGRLLRLGEMRTEILSSNKRFSFGRIAEWFISRVLAQLISGSGTRSKFYKSALQKTCARLLTGDERVPLYSIKSTFEGSIGKESSSEANLDLDGKATKEAAGEGQKTIAA